MNAFNQPTKTYSGAKGSFGALKRGFQLGTLTLLSPATGMLVEMSLAYRLGISQTVDAYRIAFVLILLANQVFLGQILWGALIPMFCQCRGESRELDGWHLVSSVGLILLLLCVSFTAFMLRRPDIFVTLYGPGLEGVGKRDALALVQYFSLALPLILASGLVSVVLQSYRIFWVTTVSQCFNNVFLVICIFAGGAGWRPLAYGNLLGYGLMVAFHLYYVVRLARAERITPASLRKLAPGRDLTRAVRLAAPLVVTLIVPAFGGMVVLRLLSGMTAGSLAEWGYASKVLQLITVLPSVVYTMSLPALSETRGRGDKSQFSALALRATRLTLLLVIPASLLIYTMRTSVVQLIFGRKIIDEAALKEIAVLLGILLLGSPGSALTAILGWINSSLQDTKGLAMAAIISTLCFVGTAPFAAATLSAVGVGIAWTASAWLAAGFLLIYQNLRFSVLPKQETFLAAVQICVFGCVLSAGAEATKVAVKVLLPSTNLRAAISVLVVAAVSTLLAYPLCRYLGLGDEVAEITTYFRWRLFGEA